MHFMQISKKDKDKCLEWSILFPKDSKILHSRPRKVASFLKVYYHARPPGTSFTGVHHFFSLHFKHWLSLFIPVTDEQHSGAQQVCHNT